MSDQDNQTPSDALDALIEDLIKALAANQIHAADCAQFVDHTQPCSCWVAP